jgi:hypothetical protein
MEARLEKKPPTRVAAQQVSQAVVRQNDPQDLDEWIEYNK